MKLNSVIDIIRPPVITPNGERNESPLGKQSELWTHRNQTEFNKVWGQGTVSIDYFVLKKKRSS